MADYISQFTGGEIDRRLAKVSDLEAGKQDKLVSGENIKTVGGQSILGEGNIPLTDQEAVKFTPQTLTAAQKAQAQANIGAASEEEVAALADQKYEGPYATDGDLPAASASTMGAIYLVGPDANDEYDRMVTKLNGSTYSWSSLGKTSIDLANYATKAEVTELEHEVDDLQYGETVLQQQIDAIHPVVIEGNVTNAPDNEDITATPDNRLKFADRSATLTNKGYKILRADKTFAEQVTDINTIYEIRYKFVVDASLCDIPSGATFLFDGGELTINNGKLECTGKSNISFIAKHGEKIIAGTSIPSATDGIICFDDTTDIVFDGLTFDNSEVNLSFLYMNDCGNIRVDNCSFGGLTTQNGTARKCIYTIGCDNVKVTNNIFKGVRGCVTFGNTLGVNTNCVFSGNVVLGTHLSAVNCFVKNAVFSANSFENVGVSAIAICGDLPSGVYSENISVVGNVFRNLNTGVQSDCTNGGSIYNVSIIGNNAINCERPLYLASASSYMVVSGNVIKGATIIGCDATRLRDSLIFNNVFEGSGADARYGIRLTVANEYNDNADNVKIFGNYVKGFKDGIYMGEYSPLHCNDIDIDTNKVEGCTRGCVATQATTNLVVRRNTFVDNTTDVDIRCSLFDFIDNTYSTKSVQTILDFTLDTSTEYPTITKEAMYDVSSSTRYVLRNFTDSTGTIKKVTIRILTENIIIGQGSGIMNLYGASYSPLVGSILSFEKRGNDWYEVPVSPWGVIPSYTDATMPPAAYRKGMFVYNSTSEKVAISSGASWKYLLFES